MKSTVSMMTVDNGHNSLQTQTTVSEKEDTPGAVNEKNNEMNTSIDSHVESTVAETTTVESPVETTAMKLKPVSTSKNEMNEIKFTTTDELIPLTNDTSTERISREFANGSTPSAVTEGKFKWIFPLLLICFLLTVAIVNFKVWQAVQEDLTQPDDSVFT